MTSSQSWKRSTATACSPWTRPSGSSKRKTAQCRAGQAPVLRRPHRPAGGRRARRLDLHRRERLGVRPKLAPGGDRPHVRPPALTDREKILRVRRRFLALCAGRTPRPTAEAPMTQVSDQQDNSHALFFFRRPVQRLTHREISRLSGQPQDGVSPGDESTSTRGCGPDLPYS